MVKIKQTKQLNLPQLIEWGWNNPSSSRRKRFYSKDEKIGIIKHLVHFNEFGYAEIENRYCLEPVDTFTVETFEEITEDTVFEKLLEIRGSGTIYPHYLEAINDEMDDFSKEFHACIDGEFKLIWRDGKLVE